MLDIDDLVLLERMNCDDECSYQRRIARYKAVRENLGELNTLAQSRPRPLVFERIPVDLPYAVPEVLPEAIPEVLPEAIPEVLPEAVSQKERSDDENEESSEYFELSRKRRLTDVPEIKSLKVHQTAHQGTEFDREEWEVRRRLAWSERLAMEKRVQERQQRAKERASEQEWRDIRSDYENLVQEEERRRLATKRSEEDARERDEKEKYLSIQRIENEWYWNAVREDYALLMSSGQTSEEVDRDIKHFKEHLQLFDPQGEGYHYKVVSSRLKKQLERHAATFKKDLDEFSNLQSDVVPNPNTLEAEEYVQYAQRLLRERIDEMNKYLQAQAALEVSEEQGRRDEMVRERLGELETLKS